MAALENLANVLRNDTDVRGPMATILHNARTNYVDARDVSGGAWEYMRESLLYWMDYHDDGWGDDLSDLRRLVEWHGLECINTPDGEESAVLLVWAWDLDLNMSGADVENLDDVIAHAGEVLETAAVHALLDYLDEMDGEGEA